MHVLWDPLQVCGAQWPAAAAAAAEAAAEAAAAVAEAAVVEAAAAATALYLAVRRVQMETSLLTLYKRERHGALRVWPRLEDLVSRRSGPAAWRQLFGSSG